MKMLAAKTPNEVKPIELDFSSVVSGSVVAQNVSKSLLVGNDIGSALLTIGTLTVSGGIISFLLSGGGADCSYVLLGSVMDSLGRQYELSVAITTTTAAS